MVITLGIDGYDVRMVEFGGCLAFTAEASHRGAVAAGEARENLERDLAVERHLVSAVYHPHPATPQFGQQLEVAHQSAE